MQTKNSLKPSITTIKKSLLHQKYHVELSRANLDFHRKKRLQSKIWQLNTPEYFEMRLRYETRRNLKSLAVVLRSVEKGHKSRELRMIFSKTKIFDGAFDFFIDTLERFPAFKSLHLDFQGSNVDDIGLKNLGCSLKRLSCLRDVHINLLNCKEVTSEGLQELAKGLKKLTRLRSLTLDLPNEEGIEEAGVNSLTQALKSLVLLRRVHLNFSNMKSFFQKEFAFNDQNLANLAKSLQKLRFLKDLDLNFEECEHITEAGISRLTPIFDALGQLESFRLNFKAVEMTEEGFEEFAQNLKKLRFLKELCLDFSMGNGVADKGIFDLSKSLKEMKELKTLNLNFSLCQISLVGIQTLNQKLKNLASLQNIGLGLSGCTSGIFESVEEVLNTRKDLHSISFDFSWGQGTSDEEILKLAQGLKNLTSLQNIHLNFTHCEQITEIGVSSLLHVIFGLTSLKTIDLIFCWPESLLLESVKEMCENFKTLPNLKAVAFDLHTRSDRRRWNGSRYPKEFSEQYTKVLQGKKN